MEAIAYSEPLHHHATHARATRPNRHSATGGVVSERATNNALEDIALVERASRGDAVAFSALVTRHYQRAVRVAFGMLHNQADAEDVVQDAFVKVHQRLGDFHGSSAFYTWLYRIVVNLSIDALRKRKRQRRANIDDEATREAMRSAEPLWPRLEEHDPGLNMERKEARAHIEKALRELSDIHRAVLLLRELEGLSYEEIATTLGVKKGTVMSRLFHARRAMQIALTKHQEPGAIE